MAVTSFALVLFVEPARTAAVGPTIRHYLTSIVPTRLSAESSDGARDLQATVHPAQTSRPFVLHICLGVIVKVVVFQFRVGRVHKDKTNRVPKALVFFQCRLVSLRLCPSTPRQGSVQAWVRGSRLSSRS
jgi:hypothetical protein